MPTQKHLQPFEVADFTQGMWNERSGSMLLAPNNAFVDIVDYQPQKAGGVRAFYKTTDVGNSGVPTPATKACYGIAIFGGRLGRSIIGEYIDAFILTEDTGDLKGRLHRMDQSNAETTWKAVGTGTVDTPAAGLFGGSTFMGELFTETGGNVFYVFAISAGGNQGLYKVAYVAGAGPPGGDGVTTKINSRLGPIAVAGARILVGDFVSSNVYYSDLGATTFTSPGSQVLNVAPNQEGATVLGLTVIQPSDILVAKEGAPWTLIQGDIGSSSSPVREMGRGHYLRVGKQQLCRLPDGRVAFIESGGRIFLTDGRNFESISDGLARFIDNNAAAGSSGPGTMAAINSLLFAPGGLVWDSETKAWFRSAGFANSFYHSTDPHAGEVWMATNTLNFGVKRINVYEGNTNTSKRVSTGSLTSVPMTDPNGRLLEIREVEVYLQCYATSTVQVDVIDSSGATVGTQSNATVTGRQPVRLLFPNIQDRYLSFKITLSANDGTSEAPTVERVKYWFGPGNLVK